MKSLPLPQQRLWIALASALLLSTLLIAFGGGLWVGALLRRVQGAPVTGRGPLPLLDEAWQLVRRDFYGDLPPPTVRMRGAVRGLLDVLGDPYTVLLDPEPAREEQQRLSGRHGSIGVSLWWAEDGAVALAPHPTGPAAEAGLQSGDRLLAIDSVSLAGTQSLEAVERLLAGDVGTEVTLTLEREGRRFTVTLTRADVVQPSVEWRVLEATPRIGYVRITLFTAETAAEVQESIESLQDIGVRALVLDLRGNGGGMLAHLDTIAGFFLEPGATLYYDVRRTSERQITVRGTPLFTGPLAVLVDGGTASAAEILAAALQEQQRAPLIGSRTFGKGSIQALYPLRDGSVMHVTQAVWLTPGHRRLDGVGLTPDESVTPLPGVDAPLEAAIAYLDGS